MTRIYTVALILLSINVTCAQPTDVDERAIRAVIETLFRGMEHADSAMVRSSLSDDASFVSMSRNKEGQPVMVRESTSKDFLHAVATPHKETWNEEYWDLSIQTDGDFASAWCPYAFYLGNTFSHCGVDAFHLHRDKNGWKIIHLSDTRHRDGCDVPGEIKRKRS